jgi:hypothetical protein
MDDVPLVVPSVVVSNDEFKVRAIVINLSEKALTLPHMQALASLCTSALRYTMDMKSTIVSLVIG